MLTLFFFGLIFGWLLGVVAFRLHSSIEEAFAARSRRKLGRQLDMVRGYVGKVVVDRASGRAGKCCCIRVMRNSKRSIELELGVSFRSGAHEFLEAGAVRLALESERDEFLLGLQDQQQFGEADE